MRITYIHHSGFAVECEKCTLIFDFYKDTAKVLTEIMQRAKSIYVFASHSHPDHFVPQILDWTNKYPEITYILSNDIRKMLKKDKSRILPAGIHILHQGETFSDQNIKVKAYGSTDIGVSYMVEVGGKRIFHAGDLNNWHWSNESTPQEIKAAIGNYLAILRDISKEVPHLHLAMFPVDPRIGGDYSLGARQFLEKIEVDHFIPMHLWGQFEQAGRFDLYKNPKHGEYHLKRDGENIEID
jgi:L-ascorbate metabolism protein UlaG (beta-lactamase superfamily)